MDLNNFLNREIQFYNYWLYSFIHALLTGLLIVYIILFLEPFDTQEYHSAYRNLKLSGYALCFIFPILIFQVINKFFYKKQGEMWVIKYELTSVGFMILVILCSCYFYNTWMINEGSNLISLSGFYRFILFYGLPTMFIILPLSILIKYQLVTPEKLSNLKSKEKFLEITGEVSGDYIKLKKEDFYYAKAQRNYVEIYYKNRSGLTKTLIRATLTNINNQISNATQVHRSFLVNPDKILRLKGNSRKRSMILKEITDPIPVSHTYIENR